MQGIQVFDKVGDYKAFIKGRVLSTDLMQNSLFYNGVVNYVIDHRTPLFFTASHPYEYAHFTQSFNFCLMREGYTNPYIEDLYYLHDFVHMLFMYPTNPRAMDFYEYYGLTERNEWVSSNETEILAYYRVPGLREKTFEFPIFYDVLNTISEKMKPKHVPNVVDLLKIRESLVTESYPWDYFVLPMFGKDNPDVLRIRSFLNKTSNNFAWSAMWYHGYPEAVKPLTLPYRSLRYDYYERDILAYGESKLSQGQYELNIIRNASFLKTMIDGQIPEWGDPDMSPLKGDFEKALDYLRGVDHQVPMETEAENFNRLYVDLKALTK